MNEHTKSAMRPAEVLTRILEAYDRRDPDAMESLIADDITDIYLPFGEFNGKSASMKMARSIFAAFPDFRLQILDIVGDDTHASAMWKASGTFTGAEFQGLKANGRKVEIRGCDFMKCSDGKATEFVVHFDGADFARQLGMLPGSGSIAERLLTTSFNFVTEIKDGMGKMPDLIRR